MMADAVTPLHGSRDKCGGILHLYTSTAGVWDGGNEFLFLGVRECPDFA